MTAVLLALACGTADSPAPPPADAPAGADAEEPPAPAPVDPAPEPVPELPAGPAGHCTASERVAFHCPTGANKALSVCVTQDDAVQYRFGPVGAPELVYPATPGAGGFVAAKVSFVRAMGHVLRFENAGVRYEVTSLIGGGCCSPEEAASNNFKGVRVTPADGGTVEVSCRDEPVDALEALLASGLLAPGK